MKQRRLVLGSVLAALRTSAGLSQTEVAIRLEKPQSFVSKYETAERRIDFFDLEQITEAIGVPLEEAITRYREAVNAG